MDMDTEILDFLSKHNGMTAKDIADILGYDEYHVLESLEAMYDKEDVVFIYQTDDCTKVWWPRYDCD